MLISYQMDLKLEALTVNIMQPQVILTSTCAWAEAPSIDLFGGGANAR